MAVLNRRNDHFCYTAALGYTDQILMGWSSGGACLRVCSESSRNSLWWVFTGSMASAFLNIAQQKNLTTDHNTSFHIAGLVLLSAGSQFCYAYDSVADLAGSKIWKACGPQGSSAGSSVGGCCPSNLTEDYCELLLRLLFSYFMTVH